MLPLARFKSQPVGMVTTTPWLSLSTEPAPQWTWLASWSAATYQATPPPLTYHPAVWIPEHSHLVQWDRPAVEVIPVLPVFYRSSPLHPYHPLPKLPEGWIPIDEVGVFTRRDKPLPQANQMAQRPVGHAPRLLSLSRLFGPVLRDVPKTRDVEAEDSCPSVLPVRLLSASPLRLPLLTAPPAGGACRQWAGLPAQGLEEVWPLIQPYQGQKGAWLQPTISNDKRLTPPTQCVFGPVCPLQLTKDKCPGLPVQFSSRFTLLTDYRHKKQLVGGAKVSYGGALLLRAESHKQGADVLMHTEEKEGGDGGENKRPVASTPVPGSPWCVVWTGDDRMFFFNPTMHLSVWERPGELIGRDISRIIEDPPHKRKKMTSADRSSSCQSLSSHGDDEDEDEDDGQKHKRNRTDESLSLVPRPGEVKLLPLELRMEHFRQMLLERGVSAFSSWEKELHKMVFDPRYLLLTSDQRKQVFEQFVKSRVKEEYKEKRSKLQKAREDFKQLLEESKVTSRSTFREFCARYHGDQRFSALTRKKDQEVLFSQHVCSLKRQDRENRAWLRRTR